jgi:spermidine/putrescine transport system permease protein
MNRRADLVLKAVAGLVLLYLFIPVAVIVAFSFNEPAGKFNFTWNRFTLDAWRDPLRFPGLADALGNSLRVAAVSTAVAVVLGSMIALALIRYRYRASGAVDLFLVLPLTTPEVVIGSALLTLFLDLGTPLGFWTIVLAHIMFQISFVALTVKARLRGFDWSLIDAAADLGAGPWRTFRTVTFPLILPGIVAAALLSFAISLDDYVITVFNAGTTVTYPLFVDAAQRSAYPPQINVLATVILVVSLTLVGAAGLWQRRRQAG